MMKFLKMLIMSLCAGIIADGIHEGLKNRSKGRTFFGKERKHTGTDWHGNVVLGSEDYKVGA